MGRDWYLVEEVEVGRTDEERGEVFYVLICWYHNPILVNMMVGRDWYLVEQVEITVERSLAYY